MKVDTKLSSLNGSVTISEVPDRGDSSWVIRDEQTDEEIAIWPEDVPEITAMLEAFRMRELSYDGADET